MKQSFCIQKQRPSNCNNQELQFSSNKNKLLERPFLRVSATCLEESSVFVWRKSMLGSMVDIMISTVQLLILRGKNDFIELW